MYGSATLAMEVSSTSMKAAIATVAAITHGFVFGFQAVMGTVAAAAAMSSSVLLLDGARSGARIREMSAEEPGWFC